MITIDRLHELLADNQTAHSDLQIDRFIILSNGITDYGCYKQALRELHSRFHTMVGYWLEIETLRLDEEDAVIKASEGRRQQLELAKVRLKLQGVQESLAESTREFLRFLGHAEHFKSKVGALTPARRAEFEREFWIENIASMGSSPQSQRLLMVMDPAAQQAIAVSTPKPLPTLPNDPAELDTENLLNMTIAQKLLPREDRTPHLAENDMFAARGGE